MLYRLHLCFWAIVYAPITLCNSSWYWCTNITAGLPAGKKNANASYAASIFVDVPRDHDWATTSAWALSQHVERMLCMLKVPTFNAWHPSLKSSMAAKALRPRLQKANGSRVANTEVNSPLIVWFGIIALSHCVLSPQVLYIHPCTLRTHSIKQLLCKVYSFLAFGSLRQKLMKLTNQF